MSKIIKILNHNAVIIHNQKKQVLLLIHKGIGFGKKINEMIDIPEQADIYRLSKLTSKGKTETLLRELDPLYIEISSTIIHQAKERFGQIDDHILLPLADHIAFAIKRIQNNLNISNPFVSEIRLLYPEEYEIALQARPLIEKHLGYKINDDEIGYITLHIHSARENSNDEGMLVAVIINESIQEIAREYHITIDVQSLSYSRLMTHMKYLLARLNENEVLKLDMEEYTKTTIPHSYEVARKIIARIEGALNKPIPVIETGYLAMHIERICHGS